MSKVQVNNIQRFQCLTIQAFRISDSAQLTTQAEINASRSRGEDVEFEVGGWHKDSSSISVFYTTLHYTDALAVLAEIMSDNNYYQYDIQIEHTDNDTKFAHIYCHYNAEDAEENSDGHHVDSVPYAHFETLPLSEMDYFFGMHGEESAAPYSIWVEKG